MTKFTQEMTRLTEELNSCFSRFSLKPENVRPESVALEMRISPISVEVLVHSNLAKSISSFDSLALLKVVEEAFIKGIPADLSQLTDFYRSDRSHFFFQKKDEEGHICIHEDEKDNFIKLLQELQELDTESNKKNLQEDFLVSQNFEFTQKELNVSPLSDWVYYSTSVEDECKGLPDRFDGTYVMQLADGISVDQINCEIYNDFCEVCCFVSDAPAFIRHFLSLMQCPIEMIEEICSSL